MTNGRFKGGYITRHYGKPEKGVHAVQLELAMRSYMVEPPVLTEQNWPSPYQRDRAAPLRALLSKTPAGRYRLRFEGSRHDPTGQHAPHQRARAATSSPPRAG